VIAPASGRAPRKPARYLSHCNALQEWHLWQATRVSAQRKAQGQMVAACMFVALAMFVAGAATVLATARSGSLGIRLAAVESEMKLLGAGAAEAGVQREYRELLESTTQHNASTINPVAVILNEIPLACWPESVTADYEQNGLQVSGRASSLTTEVKYELVRNVEDEDATLEAKIDSFGLEMRQGQQFERFTFIVRRKEASK